MRGRSINTTHVLIQTEAFLLVPTLVYRMSDHAKDEGGKPMVERDPIVQLFGQPGRTRIISVFVGDRDREYNVSEIARLANVARSTVYDHLEDLLELRVIEEVGDATPGSRYRLADSDVADQIWELDGVVLKAIHEGSYDVAE